MLALGVCYIARLEDRDSYINYIVQFFKGNFVLTNGVQQLKEEIRRYRDMKNYYFIQITLDLLNLKSSFYGSIHYEPASVCINEIHYITI